MQMLTIPEVCDLLVVLDHDEESCQKRPADLRYDIVRDLPPWKALEVGETKCDGRIEMPAGRWSADNNCERNTHAIGLDL